MDAILTELAFEFDTGFDRTIKIWCRPGFAYYEYQILDEAGREVNRSNVEYGNRAACLRDALDVVLNF